MPGQELELELLKHSCSPTLLVHSSFRVQMEHWSLFVEHWSSWPDLEGPSSYLLTLVLWTELQGMYHRSSFEKVSFTGLPPSMFAFPWR